jgi:hypothetical protein
VKILVCFAFWGVLFFQLDQTKSEDQQAPIEYARLKTKEAAEAINEKLASIKPLAQEIADSITHSQISDQDLIEFLKETLDKHPDLFGVGAAYASSAHQGTLYAPYYARLDGEDEKPRLDFIENTYDYTTFEDTNRWYHDPMLAGEPIWNQPYFGQVSQVALAEYAVPFFKKGWHENPLEPAGIIYINFSLGFLNEYLESLGLGKAGYGFIFTEDGVYVAHPQEDLVKTQKTIFETARQRNDEMLYKMAVRAIKVKTGSIRYSDDLTGQSTVIFYEPIPSTDWILAAVFLPGELKQDIDSLRQRSILAAVAIFLGIAAFWVFFLFWLGYGRTFTPWIVETIACLFLVSNIGAIWYYADKYPKEESVIDEEKRDGIIDRSTLEQLLDTFVNESEVANIETPIFIPTGLFISSIDFISGVNVQVNGYVWQKYHRDLPAGINRGVILPEAVELDLQTDPSYSREEEDYVVIGWYFKALLRQEFFYEKFPFDRQSVWVRLLHTDFDKNIILIPDLEAYDLINPIAKPGVGEDLVLPGWTVLASLFEYRYQDYNTDFGIKNYVGQYHFPELYFNINLKRKFLGPFVSKIIPLSVVAAMLLSILIISSNNPEKADLFGFSASNVILGLAALFFVLIFDHISLRGSLASVKMIYFEFFYFAMYIMMMLVSINAILLATKTKLWFFDYGENLIPKVTFLPLYLTMVLWVTFIFFY